MFIVNVYVDEEADAVKTLLVEHKDVKYPRNFGIDFANTVTEAKARRGHSVCLTDILTELNENWQIIEPELVNVNY
jgi:hypothetical protein